MIMRQIKGNTYDHDAIICVKYGDSLEDNIDAPRVLPIIYTMDDTNATVNILHLTHLKFPKVSLCVKYQFDSDSDLLLYIVSACDGLMIIFH